MANNSGLKFLIIVLVVVVVFSLLYCFSGNGVSMMPQRQVMRERFVENMKHGEDGEDGEDSENEGFTDYEMQQAQMNSPETETEKSNNPPLVGQDMQANLSVNPALKQLRQAACFPKEVLTPEELKPQDNSSLWAQVNPAGAGSLKGRNFLQAGHNIGINTVGQTLRNANLQLRSDPPNPQVQVSPWNQTTIEPDMNRRPFEIGGCS